MRDSLMQRAVIVFDHCMAKLSPTGEDEVLLYQLVAALYLTIKVENRASYP